MDRGTPTASSTIVARELAAAGDTAATIESLRKQIAYLRAQLEVHTRPSTEVHHNDAYNGNNEPNSDGVFAMDWEPWMESFKLDKIDLELEDRQEQSGFPHNVSCAETTPNVFSEFPSIWFPSNPDQIMLDDPVLEEDLFRTLPPSLTLIFPETHQTPNAVVSGDQQSSSCVPEVHGVRARRAVLSVTQKDTLDNWILVHPDPYPTKQNKEELSQLTGLSIAQVSSWFSRTRHRKLKRVRPTDSCTKMAPTEAAGYFEAWQPPENLFAKQGRRIEFEPTQAERASSGESNRKRGATEWEGQQRIKKRAGSASSRVLRQSNNSEQTKERTRKYACTFCEDSFGRPSSWKRHEESIHAPQKHWVCGPPRNFKESSAVLCPVCNAPFINSDANNDRWCAPDGQICLGNDTNGRQWSVHGFQNCWEKPKGYRTFYRKDSLQQHASFFHMKNSGLQQADIPFQLDDWVEEADVSRYDLKYYFCGQSNDDWHQRARHIISHFDDGWTIDKWMLARNWELFPAVRRTVGELEPMPLNIYESLLRPVEAPKRDDTWLWTSGPVKQRQFHEEGNLHHPSWIRQGPLGDDWWCGFCRPGRWMPDYDRASWDEHMMFTHGLSTIFYNLPCPGPLEMRLKKEPEYTCIWHGLCMFCCNWIELTSDEEGGMKWFRHAAQCWKELVGRRREVPIHITSLSELQVLLQHQLKPIQGGPIPFAANSLKI
ncbi:hypothetical protein GGR55DRAFT_703509 [Xylaria sp. FL0064]|nr:hypothetical protein GGR55DRAFT_703509 [Xylaria sp. FL0064]